MNRNQARERAWMLYRDLQKISADDSEQELAGVVVPLIDALLRACKEFVPDDPIVGALDGLITPEGVESGSIRVIDVVPAVGQLAAALGPERSLQAVGTIGGKIIGV